MPIRHIGGIVAHTVSGRKRVRQNIKRNERNTAYKSTMKTMVKKYLAAVEANDKEKAAVLLHDTSAFIAKLGGKGILHQNKASKKISRLTRKMDKIA